MSNEEIKNKVIGYFDNSTNSQFELKKFIEENTEIICDIVSMFLPASLQKAIRVAKSKIQQNNSMEQPDYRKMLRDGTSSTNVLKQEQRNTTEKHTTEKQYSIVDDTKEKINKFFMLLDAMLFDHDFGFIGFYQSQFEEFRLSLLEEVEDGCIVDIARCFREIVWPEEQVFKISNLRKEKLAQIENIKALIMN